MSLADVNRLEIVVSALTYSTVYYVLSRYENNEIIKEKIRKFKVLAYTADLTNKAIDQGLSSPFKDFEDALQYYRAVQSGCNE